MLIVTVPFNKLIRGILGVFAIGTVLAFAQEPTQIQLAFFSVAICIGLLFNRAVQKWLINLAKRAYKVLITKEI